MAHLAIHNLELGLNEATLLLYPDEPMRFLLCLVSDIFLCFCLLHYVAAPKFQSVSLLCYHIGSEYSKPIGVFGAVYNGTNQFKCHLKIPLDEICLLVCYCL